MDNPLEVGDQRLRHHTGTVRTSRTLEDQTNSGPAAPFPASGHPLGTRTAMHRGFMTLATGLFCWRRLLKPMRLELEVAVICGQICALGEVLAQQAVRVLVGAMPQGACGSEKYMSIPVPGQFPALVQFWARRSEMGNATHSWLFHGMLHSVALRPS